MVLLAEPGTWVQVESDWWNTVVDLDLDGRAEYALPIVGRPSFFHVPQEAGRYTFESNYFMMDEVDIEPTLEIDTGVYGMGFAVTRVLDQTGDGVPDMWSTCHRWSDDVIAVIEPVICLVPGPLTGYRYVADGDNVAEYVASDENVSFGSVLVLEDMTADGTADLIVNGWGKADGIFTGLATLVSAPTLEAAPLSDMATTTYIGVAYEALSVAALLRLPQ